MSNPVKISDPRVTAARGARADGLPEAVNADQYDHPIGPRNDIATKVQAHIEQFVAFNNPHHSRVLSLWALHTWVFDAFRITPYLYVSSIDPGAGKTTLMKVMSGLVRDPNMTASVSPASLYRSLSDGTPTLILDELDTVYSGAKNEDLRGVLNSGYDATGTVSRYDAKEGGTVSYPTYSPKLLGGIDNGQVPATVMDRCLRIRLRKLDGDTLHGLGVVDYDLEEIEDDLMDIQELVKKWGDVHVMQAIKDTKVERVEGLSGREWQLIRPLLRIAKYLGMEAEARESLTATLKGEKVMTPESEALSKIRQWFDSNDTDRIPTAIASGLTGYTPAVLSRMLSPMDVTARPMKIDGKTQRGYFRPELESAFSRFLD